MGRRATSASVLLVIIAILALLAVPGCGSDSSDITSEDLPEAAVEVEWERSLAAPKDLGARSIQQTLDGGYFIVGSTDCSYGSMMHITGCDLLLIKTDATGNIEWQENKSSQWWHVSSAFQTSDGGYIFGFNDKLVKTDAAGDEEWQKALPRVSDTGSIVGQTSDGGYIVLGTTVFWGSHGGSDAWLAKLDSSGNVEWEKTLGNGSGRTVEQTFDNGFILLCGRGWLLKTDWTGQQERDGIVGHGPALGVVETTDGGFIIQSVDDNGKCWLTKVGSAGHFVPVQWDYIYTYQWSRASVQQMPAGGCIVLNVGDDLISLAKIDSAGSVEWEATFNTSASIWPMAPTSDGGYVGLRYEKDQRTGESEVVRLVKLKVTPP